MNFIDKVGATLSDSVDFLVNKNRQCAQLNRLDAIIRNETEIINRAYIALGKIYLKKLEGESVDADTKLIVDSINISKLRLKKAIARYEYIQKFGVPNSSIGNEYSNVGLEQYGENRTQTDADDDEGDITIAYSGDTEEAAEPETEKESVESIVIEEVQPQSEPEVKEEAPIAPKKSTAADLKKKRTRKKPIVKSTEAEAASESETVL